MKMDLLQPPKEKKGYAVYLVGSGWCYLLGAGKRYRTLKWFLPHPPYFPDIPPPDYYLFRSMAHGLADHQFRSYEDIEKWLDSWIVSKYEHFYRNCI